MTFKQFLQIKAKDKRAFSEDYSVDFANDALKDSNFPEKVKSTRQVYAYMESICACENAKTGAIQAVNEYFKIVGPKISLA